MKASTLQHSLLAFTLAVLPLTLVAQDKPAEPQETATPQAYSAPDPHITDCSKFTNRTQANDCRMVHAQTYTITLVNATQQNDANEILVAIRNLFDPSIKVFLVASRNLITISTYPEEFRRIEALVKTLDFPRKTYRLTYTLTDFDGDKRIGTQHFTMIAVAGQRTTLKQGSKVPVATGSYDSGKASTQTQFTYLDVGMNFDATVDEYSGGVRIKNKVESSSLAPEPVNIAGVNEPIVRQTVLEGVTSAPLGKPAILGSIDIVGSTRRVDIAVSVEAIP